MNSLVNFRDLGGIQNLDGLFIKKNRLLRSGEIFKLSEEDKKCLIENYQLKQVIDFRSPVEIKEKPVDLIEGVTYLHLDIFSDSLKDTPSLESMLKFLTPRLADDFMKEANRLLITLESARLGYQEFFKSCLKNKEGALLFHCAAGKDRTGLGAALLLKALNVGDDEIMLEYLKTNEQRAEINQELIKEAQEKGLTEGQLSALESVFSVKKEYLETAFETIKSEYKSFENYFKKGLGITDNELRTLRKEYLTK